MTPDPSAPHTAISRRWRAQTFAQIVGQGPVVETLRNAVRLGRVGHAYLFVGPRGTGKTSMARIVAKAVNCTDLRDGDPCDACPSCVAIREGIALDVAEFDAASNNTVSDMRELLPRVHTIPSDLRRKVFIVDEVQRIKEGWDVLLKTLEEPPPHVLFVFCTTDPTQIRPAVLSRVQRFAFRPLTVSQISSKLERILADEGRAAEPDAVRLVAELATGGMRDAESMLDQLLSSGPDVLTADEVRAQLGLAATAEVDALLASLLTGDALAGMAVLDSLDAAGRDVRQAVEQAIERLRRLLFSRLAGEPVPEPFAAYPVSELARAARSLASVDPARGGGGGVRLQVELLLLAGTSAAGPADSSLIAPAVRPPEPRSAPRQPVTAVPVIPDPSLAPTAVPVTAAPVVEAPVASRASAGPSAPAAPGHPEDLLERVRVDWPQIVATLSRQPPLRPLVEVCRPVRIEGHVVVLGFPEDKGFLREKAEQRHTAFEDAISGVVGTGLAIRCVATNLEALPPLPHEAIGRENLEAARRVFAGDLADAGDVG